MTEKQVPDEMLTPKEVGPIFGVHERTVHRWMKAKILPAVNINGRWYVTRTAIFELSKPERKPQCPKT